MTIKLLKKSGLSKTVIIYAAFLGNGIVTVAFKTKKIPAPTLCILNLFLRKIFPGDGFESSGSLLWRGTFSIEA